MSTRGNLHILGITGAGKTTLAKKIAAKTGRVVIDLDEYSWEPNWHEVAHDEFARRVASAIEAAKNQGKEWVVSGNYSRIRPVVWPHVHTIVILDYAPWRVLWQLIGRSFRRAFTGELCCNGNRETFGKLFLSKDSILLWFFKSALRRRKQFADLRHDNGGYPHIKLVYLHHPKETEKWLNSLV